MNVTINTTNLYETIFDEMDQLFSDIDKELETENEEQEIDEFTSFMVAEMKRETNPPKKN